MDKQLRKLAQGFNLEGRGSTVKGGFGVGEVLERAEKSLISSLCCWQKQRLVSVRRSVTFRVWHAALMRRRPCDESGVG